MNGSDASTHLSKVHFDAEDQLHDSEIVVREEGDACRSVHLGFLQLNHQYEVTFCIKDNLNEDLASDNLQNLHAKIKRITPTEDGEGHQIVVDLNAHKEKLMKEELVVSDVTDTSKQLTLILRARVLGPGKGTPSLREGVHCTGINADEDSEQSDWQGFD